MRDLRGLFNHARKRYSRKSLGIIRIEHYPFEEFKIVDAPQTEKRNTQVKRLRILGIVILNVIVEQSLLEIFLCYHFRCVESAWQ